MNLRAGHQKFWLRNRGTGRELKSNQTTPSKNNYLCSYAADLYFRNNPKMQNELSYHAKI